MERQRLQPELCSRLVLDVAHDRAAGVGASGVQPRASVRCGPAQEHLLVALGLETVQHQRRATLFETTEPILGKWTDFRFQIRFSPRDSGMVRGWVNGKQVVDYHGVNAYQENAATGYSSPGRYYFKMGMYRDVMKEPMTVYLDEYRKRELPSGQ